MPSIPEEIIIRHIRRTATDEELATLNKWLEEDKKNLEYYSQLEEIWYAGRGLPEEMIHKGWSRLSSELISRSPQKSIPAFPRKKPFLLWIRYVAAVIVGIAVSSLVWLSLDAGKTKPGKNVLVQHVVSNKSGVHAVRLPDSSDVWVNANSKIVYPEKFSDEKREVLLEGNAYFDIRKNPQKPFIVHIGDVDVTVKGTEFFVESVSDRQTTVTLISGSVNLEFTDKHGEGRSVSLAPGQQASIELQSSELNISEVDTYYYVAWKDGTYRFTDEPLEKIAGILAKRYGWDIQMPDALKKKRFTGRITFDDNPESILSILGKSYPIHYRIKGKQVIIREQ